MYLNVWSILVWRGPESSQNFSREIRLHSRTFSFQVSPWKRRERPPERQERRGRAEGVRPNWTQTRSLWFQRPEHCVCTLLNPSSRPCPLSMATLASRLSWTSDFWLPLQRVCTPDFCLARSPASFTSLLKRHLLRGNFLTTLSKQHLSSSSL